MPEGRRRAAARRTARRIARAQPSARAIGPIDVIELAELEEEDATAFLADLRVAIGCASVECLDIATILRRVAR